jgi:hypothetical protein
MSEETITGPESPVDEVEQERMSEKAAAVGVPYMSFVSFRSYLDRFREQGLPAVLDRSFFGNQSGSLTAQVRGTMKALGLINEEYRPTPLLERLASSDDETRIRLLRDLTLSKYEDAQALGATATQGQLADVFRARGISGATVTKAITFYLALAEYVGIEISPFFKTTNFSGNGGRRPARKRPSAPAPPPVVQPATAPQVSMEEQKKSAYIDLLMELAKGGDGSSSGTDRQDLLDRIERAIGIPGTPTATDST